MDFLRRSIFWRLMLPVPVIMLALVLVAVVIPGQVHKLVVNAAVESATSTVEQFKTVRAYYTQNVIQPILASGGPSPAIEHQDDPTKVPLPATMVHRFKRALVSERRPGEPVQRLSLPESAESAA